MHYLFSSSLTQKLLLISFTLSLLTACATTPITINEGEYTSPNRMFSTIVPEPSNWANLPYAITVLNASGDNQHDKVMFHVGDFGEYLVVSARKMPLNSSLLMDKDDHRTVLQNISEATLMSWRHDFSEIPEISEESFIDSLYGEAIIRVYRAKKGSLLTKTHGQKTIADDRFDTNIASIVARKGEFVAYILLEIDSDPDSSHAIKEKASQVFRNLRILPTQ